MKPLTVNILLFHCLLIIGCDNTEKGTKKSFDVTVKNTETYKYNLGVIGLEDSGRIKAEPSHALISELVIDGDGYLMYTYQPQANFVGKDKAQIEICKSIGNGKCYATELTTIKFTVTD